MASIRPFERADLNGVAGLYELVMRSGGSSPAPGLAAYFERLFFDQPWADPELPGLVAVDHHGGIVAFQGAHARRARFDGKPIRILCLGQLVAHPGARHRAVGRALARTHIAGPQDLTITDTANEPVQRLGQRIGGTLAHLQCIGWVRVLRPARSAHGVLRQWRHARRGPAGAGLVSTLDRALAQVPRLAPPAAPSDVGQPLDPASLVENLPLISEHVRLYPDYDEAYVGWLFGELERMRGWGTLVPRLVRSQRGRVLGWYVCVLERGGSCRVLQVVARDRDVGRVLDHLLYEAWSAGAANVHGRLEPRLLEPVAERRCLTIYRGGALMHSTDRELLGAIALGDALLTRLDGEWWVQDRMVDLSR